MIFSPLSVFIPTNQIAVDPCLEIRWFSKGGMQRDADDLFRIRDLSILKSPMPVHLKGGQPSSSVGSTPSTSRSFSLPLSPSAPIPTMAAASPFTPPFVKPLPTTSTTTMATGSGQLFQPSAIKVTPSLSELLKLRSPGAAPVTSPSAAPAPSSSSDNTRNGSDLRSVDDEVASIVREMSSSLQSKEEKENEDVAVAKEIPVTPIQSEVSAMQAASAPVMKRPRGRPPKNRASLPSTAASTTASTASTVPAASVPTAPMAAPPASMTTSSLSTATPVSNAASVSNATSVSNAPLPSPAGAPLPTALSSVPVATQTPTHSVVKSISGSVRLSNWCFAPIPNNPKFSGITREQSADWIVLVGRREDMTELWHSSIVSGLVSPTEITTGSGRLYELVGPPDAKAMAEHGFDAHFTRQWEYGFPLDTWKDLLRSELKKIALGPVSPPKQEDVKMFEPSKAKVSHAAPEMAKEEAAPVKEEAVTADLTEKMEQLSTCKEEAIVKAMSVDSPKTLSSKAVKAVTSPKSVVSPKVTSPKAVVSPKVTSPKAVSTKTVVSPKVASPNGVVSPKVAKGISPKAVVTPKAVEDTVKRGRGRPPGSGKKSKLTPASSSIKATRHQKEDEVVDNEGEEEEEEEEEEVRYTIPDISNRTPKQKGKSAFSPATVVATSRQPTSVQLESGSVPRRLTRRSLGGDSAFFPRRLWGGGLDL